MRRMQRRRRIEKLRAHKAARVARRARRCRTLKGLQHIFAGCPARTKALLAVARRVVEELAASTDMIVMPGGYIDMPISAPAQDPRKRARAAWAGWDAAEVERELRAWPDEEGEEE